MKTLKKLLSSVSALAIFALAVAPSVSAFSDVPAGHWVESYLAVAVEEGVVDGTKDTFRPNDEMNRAELTKIVVNYDNGGEDPIADDYTEVAGFSDVSSDAWYFNHVNYAAEQGIVDGTKSEFRPAASVTRAEALKMIVKALEVPTDSTNMIPYSDVSSADWYYEYVTTAYNNCIIKDATAFRPNDTVTRAEAVKMFVASLEPGCEVVEPTVTVSPTTTTTPTTTTVSSNTVEVVVKGVVPTTSVPKGGTNIDFLALDITAGSAEDVKLTGLAVYHTGHGDESDIDSVKVFDGYAQRGGDKSFASDTYRAELNLGSESIVIPAGTTKTVYVKGDISSDATSSVSHGVQILSASDVMVYGVETGGKVAVSGSFPLAGPQREVANFKVGSLSFTYQPVANSSLEVGVKAAEVANLKVETGAEEDVYLKALTVETKDLDDGDLANLFVEVDGKVVSNVVAATSRDQVTFDFTSVNPMGLLIQDSSTEYLYIKADLTQEIDSFDDNNYLFIDDASSDVVAVGARHGFEIKKGFNGVKDDADGLHNDPVDSEASTTNKEVGAFAIEGGDLEFSFVSESGDIPNDKDNVVFATLKIENMGGEAEIQKGLKLTLQDSAGATVATNGLLDNVRLVNKATGATVFGPTNPKSGVVDFGDEYYIPATATVELELQADVNDAAAGVADGQKFKFSLNLGSFDVKGGPNLDEVAAVTVKPSSPIATNVKTVATPSVTFTRKSLNPDFVVEDADEVLVWNGTVRAGTVEDVKVTRFTFIDKGTATTTDVRDYSLYAVVNGEEVALETKKSGVDDATDKNYPFSFSSLANGGLSVTKGAEIELRLKANIGSEITANRTIKLRLDSVIAKDSDGDTTSVTVTVPEISDGETAITLVDKGEIYADIDNARTPDAAIAVAGSTLPVAVYKLKASYEDVKVEKLNVTVTEKTVAGVTTSGNVDAIALYYQDTATPVLKVGGAQATASVSNEAALLEGLDLTIPEGKDVYLEVRAITRGMSDTDSAQTAKSGSTFSVTLDTDGTATDIKGAESGTELTVADPESSDVFTVYNNKLIATEVALSNTTLTVGTKQLLKVKLDVQGDNEVYLTKLYPVVNTSTGVTVTNLVLKDSSGKVVEATYTPADPGNATTPPTVAVISLTNPEVVKSGGTYTIEGTVGGTIESGSSVSVELVVNSGTDGIEWKDYGTNKNGELSTWIDLGTSSVSRISGSLKN